MFLSDLYDEATTKGHEVSYRSEAVFRSSNKAPKRGKLYALEVCTLAELGTQDWIGYGRVEKKNLDLASIEIMERMGFVEEGEVLIHGHRIEFAYRLTKSGRRVLKSYNHYYCPCGCSQTVEYPCPYCSAVEVYCPTYSYVAKSCNCQEFNPNDHETILDLTYGSDDELDME